MTSTTSRSARKELDRMIYNIQGLISAPRPIITPSTPYVSKQSQYACDEYTSPPPKIGIEGTVWRTLVSSYLWMRNHWNIRSSSFVCSRSVSTHCLIQLQSANLVYLC